MSRNQSSPGIHVGQQEPAYQFEQFDLEDHGELNRMFGTLLVYVASANGLAKGGRTYVKAEIGKVRMETTRYTEENTPDPQWKEGFIFPIDLSENADAILKLSCFEGARFSRDSALGHTSLKVKDLVQSFALENHELTLENATGAFLRISTVFTPMSAPVARSMKKKHIKKTMTVLRSPRSLFTPGMDMFVELFHFAKSDAPNGELIVNAIAGSYMNEVRTKPYYVRTSEGSSRRTEYHYYHAQDVYLDKSVAIRSHFRRGLNVLKVLVKLPPNVPPGGGISKGSAGMNYSVAIERKDERNQLVNAVFGGKAGKKMNIIPFHVASRRAIGNEHKFTMTERDVTMEGVIHTGTVVHAGESINATIKIINGGKKKVKNVMMYLHQYGNYRVPFSHSSGHHTAPDPFAVGDWSNKLMKTTAENLVVKPGATVAVKFQINVSPSIMPKRRCSFIDMQYTLVIKSQIQQTLKNHNVQFNIPFMVFACPHDTPDPFRFE